MRVYALAVVLSVLLCGSGLAQPTQSNATGPATTQEPAATQVNPDTGVTGAALVPDTNRTGGELPPTRRGAGNTAPGLYVNEVATVGEVLTTATVANPHGRTVIQNPGIRSGTLPKVQTDNAVSQTNLGAKNTGRLNAESRLDSEPNRAPVSQPGAASGRSANSVSGAGEAR